MLNELIELIQDTFSPTMEVTKDTALKIDLELDSFESINLICILEEKYKISINEMDMVSLITVNDLCNYLMLKTS